MKKYLRRLLVAAGALVISPIALSQSVTVSDVSATPGTTTPAISVDYTAGGGVVGFQFDILFDDPPLGNPALSCNADLGGACDLTCSTVPNGIRVICFDSSLSVQPTGNIGTFTLDLDSSASIGQVYPLTIDISPAGFGFSDAMGGTVPPASLDDGSVTGEVPPGESFYSSTPDAGGLLDIGTAEVGDTVTGGTLQISNLGDTAFDVISLTASDAEVATPTTGTVPGNDSVGYAFNCTPDTRGANTGTITAEHNADGGPTGPSGDVVYDYTCTGLAPFINAPAGPINLSGLTVDPGGPQEAFDVVNLDDGLTSDATNFTASIVAGGDPEITVAPNGPLTIATGATVPFVVSCDNTAAGNFAATVRLEWDQPDEPGGTDFEEIGVACEIQDAVPSFAGTPAAPGPIAFGTITNGTTSPAAGIDVFNDGVGTGPASELTIASVATSDPQFAATLINAGPYAVGTPGDGTADIEVTCTPDAGTTGGFSGTLTVTHNGDDSPTSYDLTCSGETDATFASTPADGGTLNLGVVPPATVTPPGDLVFSNTGAADSYDVSCSVTDPDGVFTFTPDPISFTVGPGASESAEFQCSPTAPGLYQADVACTITGADVTEANYFVTCQGQPLVIPTLDRWGLLLMALALLALGGLAGRRMMA